MRGRVTMPPPIAPAGATLGVEEEYHLVDPATSELVSCTRHFDTNDYLQRELQSSQLEIGTHVCHTLTELREELVKARRAAGEAAAQSNAAILAAGTHPFAHWRDLKRFARPRYDALAD